MAKRAGWENLSPGYRSRLEKKGMTKAAYDAGASLKPGRGHEHTPERPTAKNVTASNFPSYFARRQRLMRDVEAKKQRVFGQSPRWDTARSNKAIREHPPSIRDLEWAMAATDEEIINAIREDPEKYRWLGYH